MSYLHPVGLSYLSITLHLRRDSILPAGGGGWERERMEGERERMEGERERREGERERREGEREN